MNAPDRYPRSRAFAQLERALALLYRSKVEFERELVVHANLYFILLDTQSKGAAEATMAQLSVHYRDLCDRPEYWSRMRDACTRRRHR